MRILRIVPMFRRNATIESFIPQLQGFSADEEIEILTRVERAIPQKNWAFVQNCIPHDYKGVMITQGSSPARIAELRQNQFDIIGYNFEVRVGVKELIEQCNAVALDINYSQCDQLISLMSVYGDQKTKKIALCVNSKRDFDIYSREGFDFFIGDFYTKTVYSGGQAKSQVSPVKANKLALLSEISQWEHDPNRGDMDKFAQIIQRDVYLTMSLIKMANSSFFGGRTKVSELKDALIRIGMDNLTKWSMAILATDLTEDETPEISRVALIRAKFMENIAVWVKTDKWLSFFTGMASVSGVIMGKPLEEALKDMKAPDEVLSYLQYQGDIGRLFGMVESYISGDRMRLDSYLRGDASLVDRLYIAYLNAELWVADILSNLDTAK